MIFKKRKPLINYDIIVKEWSEQWQNRVNTFELFDTACTDLMMRLKGIDLYTIGNFLLANNRIDFTTKWDFYIDFSCSVCLKKRLGYKIGVHVHDFNETYFKSSRNVRYCKDNYVCEKIASLKEHWKI